MTNFYNDIFLEKSDITCLDKFTKVNSVSVPDWNIFPWLDVKLIDKGQISTHFVKSEYVSLAVSLIVSLAVSLIVSLAVFLIVFLKVFLAVSSIYK